MELVCIIACACRHMIIVPVGNSALGAIRSYDGWWSKIFIDRERRKCSSFSTETEGNNEEINTQSKHTQNKPSVNIEKNGIELEGNI